MKIVIDTNVLISAALAGRDPAAIIIIIVANPDYFEWVVSTEILCFCVDVQKTCL